MLLTARHVEETLTRLELTVRMVVPVQYCDWEVEVVQLASEQAENSSLVFIALKIKPPSTPPVFDSCRCLSKCWSMVSSSLPMTIGFGCAESCHDETDAVAGVQMPIARYHRQGPKNGIRPAIAPLL
ncbi:unnamed protein product [Soboliphyme baturini]|uniref:Peptidase S1 domain-containing protein n=1 Tax=Soboliphyme baturini TaxID=241478 RepID=A0A183IYT5_9BILA|nr:unnamed protein product [Soboliphyme baturini]